MKRRGPPKKIDTVKEAHSKVLRSILCERPNQGGASPRNDCLVGKGTVLLDDPVHIWQSKLFGQVSNWPFDLDSGEREMLNRYIQHFSRTYPAFAAPNNPFLRIFMPLTMQSRTVLDAVLALSCVQSWENGTFLMKTQMLKYRHRALKGCMKLINGVMSESNIQQQLSAASSADEVLQIMASKALSLDMDDIVHLLAVCSLLLLYEKLSGETQENGTAHLHFFAQLFPARLFASMANNSLLSTHQNEGIRFISNLFLYNDLVRSTSFQIPTLSTFYLEKAPTHAGVMALDRSLDEEEDRNRFEFPSIIARISNGDTSVTDEEIAAWDGRLDWFPSFALDTSGKGRMYDRLPVENHDFVTGTFFQDYTCFALSDDWSEHDVISELYRVAGAVYRRQQRLRHLRIMEVDDDTETPSQNVEMGNLPLWAVDLVRRLPLASRYENTLLWPISIIAKELKTKDGRDYILSRLGCLEKRFQMKHFSVVRAFLVKIWSWRDEGLEGAFEEPVLFG